jgi:hypothetical protein
MHWNPLSGHAAPASIPTNGCSGSLWLVVVLDFWDRSTWKVIIGLTLAVLVLLVIIEFLGPAGGPGRRMLTKARDLLTGSRPRPVGQSMFWMIWMSSSVR